MADGSVVERQLDQDNSMENDTYNDEKKDGDELDGYQKTNGGDDKTPQEISDDSISEGLLDEDKEVTSLKDDAQLDEKKDKTGVDGDHKTMDKTPQVGMVFKSYGEACNFYKQHAQRIGFGAAVRRSSFTKYGQCDQLVLACCKWGKGGKGRTDARYQSRPTAKTNCSAMIRLKLRGDGLLHLEKANLEHNHALNPSMTQFLRCFKILSNEKVIRPNRLCQTLFMKANEHENMPFGESECKNSIPRGCLKLGEGGDEAIHQFFTRMQTKNSNFFYLVDLDEEGRLRNVFWADTRSRAAYQYFGDVISLETTCLTNKYDMPLVLFVGVNHHGQSVFLGCGLLSDETTETYIWLFRAWLACMLERLPNAIITDNCKAIQVAVAEVFPQAHHRLCLWHTMQKIPDKLRGYAEYKAIKKELKKIAYESLRINEFEEDWRKMIEGYGLEGNEWLSSLYENRHCWVPAFLKDTFWAGMSTTQRKENTNSFFDGFVHPKTSLKQFVCKYETALQSKYEKEAQADYESFHRSRHSISKFYMEEQLSKLYTLHMFKKFQDELKATMYCDVSLVKVGGPISTFEVKECAYMEDGKKTENKDREVLYNADELDVQCICGSFQFRGILCRHVLSVFKLQQVYEIPSQYVLNRWRKDFKRLHALARPANDVIANTLMERYDYLSMRCLQLVELGFLSDDRYQLALKLIREVEKFLLDDCTGGERQPNLIPPGTRSNENNENLLSSWLGISKGNTLLNPVQVRRRGRPPKKRKECNIEILAASNKKKDSLRTSLEQNRNDVFHAAPNASHISTHIVTQGGIDLMEEVNPNDLSFGSHFGMLVNHQHHIGNESGIPSSNMLQDQYDQHPVGNQSRMQWIYQQMLQEDQMQKAPSGQRTG